MIINERRAFSQKVCIINVLQMIYRDISLKVVIKEEHDEKKKIYKKAVRTKNEIKK